MIACTPAVSWPNWRVLALAVGVQVPCQMLLSVVAVAVHHMKEAGAPAAALWIVAFATGSLPLIFFKPAVDRALSDELLADAQLGLFFGATAFSFSFFRTIEAAWGTSPDGSRRNLQTWVQYFTAPVDPRYHEGKVMVPAPGTLMRTAARIPARMIALGAILSVGTPRSEDPMGPTPLSLAALKLMPAWLAFLVVNHIYSVGLWLFLALCFDLGALTLLVQGVDVTDSFNNPVFGAKSPKEFWGKRWNKQVNALLRRVCFLPLAPRVGLTAAALATFATSAAFHEYQFALTFRQYTPGAVGLFFVINGALCVGQTVVEKLTGRYCPNVRVGYAALVPEALKVLMNILVLTPFGHLFMHIWLQHGMIETISRIVPTLDCAFVNATVAGKK
mmetsp:Transcript_8012/g.23489  ORF Transcript_8012/g.23489 Transcript_8012/m.23489 type:complete len:389 (-) Transcript_8012:134-1300(-)